MAIRIFTIGYEGSDILGFLAALQSAGIRKLADVRALPLSRKRGFSKNSLREALEARGIAYLHYRELGDPKPGRDAARAGDLGRFRAIYGDHLRTQPAREALKELARIARDDATCLMCYERDPTHCHRSIILQELSGFESVDLFPISVQRLEYSKRGAGGRARESAAATQ